MFVVLALFVVAVCLAVTSSDNLGMEKLQMASVLLPACITLHLQLFCFMMNNTADIFYYI